MTQQVAIIIGAGPAGLTAAYELLSRTRIKPIILEMDSCVGGISRTVKFKGNRIDIGGHRFFSKSDRVFEWWLERMPMQKLDSDATTIKYRQRSREFEARDKAPDPEIVDRVMLLRQRKSRIYFLRRFFDYPISLSKNTLLNLGLFRVLSIGASYVWVRLFPIRNETNLEEFLTNRFGRVLYRLFFKSYTEKVWGVPCDEISAAWGAQRIKGLSITSAIAHAIKKPFLTKSDITQKETETSLIEQFAYPKQGPGQMWEIVAEQVKQRGGVIVLNSRVTRLHVKEDRVVSVDATDAGSKETTTYSADYFFSTMPVKELIETFDSTVPPDVKEVASGLVYRDFITVGLLLKGMKVGQVAENGGRRVSDNWIYIQEPDVHLGRLQIFNNWSPYMVADPSLTWVGLEYFCAETDRIWQMSDSELKDLAAGELTRIGIIDKEAVLDGTVVRMPKTYPAYFGTYDRFKVVKEYMDRFSNIFLIGRNGMHKYNNQDHSMLTAMVAVDNIVSNRTDKSNIWGVNTEEEYHESKSG